MRRAKYGNRRTTIDGITFDSKREALRYLELKAMERDGLIRNLELQKRIALVVNGVKVCAWVADFVYHDEQSQRVEYEDTKGYRTRDYKIKAKLFRAIYGQEIRET